MPNPPEPREGEQLEEFMSRCVNDEVLMLEVTDESQRQEVCRAAWTNRNATTSTDQQPPPAGGPGGGG